MNRWAKCAADGKFSTIFVFFQLQNCVLGLNGAGKSTLLKIMAGVDREIEAKPSMPASRLATFPGAGT